MKALIATTRTNGAHGHDFDHCIPGELVTIADACECCRYEPTGCGCGVAFSGLNSHRATTTAEVAQVELSAAEVREAIRSSMEAGGWLDPQFCPPELAADMVEEAFSRVAQAAGHFPLGTVLGRRMDEIYPRPEDFVA